MSTVSTEPLQTSKARDARNVHLSYRPDIDGLRAIAALAVLGSHADWLPGGGAGVDVFFVISGFLITGIVLRAIGRGAFSLLDFYGRRVRRIFPALLALLLVVWWIGWLVLTPQQYSDLTKDIAAGAGFAENLWFYATFTQRIDLPSFIITHLWTLGIEEQFYLVWPVLLWATRRLERAQFVVIAAVTVLSLASCVWTAPVDQPAAWLLPWNRLWELSMGGALAYARLGTFSLIGRPPAAAARQLGFLLLPAAGHVLSTLGAACLVASLWGLVPTEAWPAAQSVTASVGSLLLIAAGMQSWVNRHVLGTRILVLIGLCSYPLYLWHVSIFVLMPIVVDDMHMNADGHVPFGMKMTAATASIVLSWLTYRYLELPIRSSKRIHRTTTLLCLAMALCGGAAVVASH